MIKKIKKRKKTISQLKKEVWKVFSKWIRERDNYTCFTCGKIGKESFMHGGHYISRKHNATMFDEKNVNAQCMNCNLWGYGNMGVYTLKLQAKYGEGIIKKLTEKSKIIKQFTEKELLELKEIYENKLKNL